MSGINLVDAAQPLLARAEQPLHYMVPYPVAIDTRYQVQQLMLMDDGSERMGDDERPRFMAMIATGTRAVRGSPRAGGRSRRPGLRAAPRVVVVQGSQ